MTSKIKVDNITNQSDSNIVNKCGTTITLGASGDTINLASGASQTGFGRTGTVDWDTTAKTATFTAANGEGYFANTSGGAFTMNLPASPSAGNIVSVKDYLYTFATNNLTIGRNGSKIGGASDVDLTISTNGSALTFIYVDSTQGWLVVNESTDTSRGLTPAFVAATGGTITCCGDFKIHTFTGPGTFCVSCAGNAGGSNTVDYLVVAGGGGGGGENSSNASGGGAGAGGYRESSGAASGCYTASPLGACVSALPVSVQGYSIAIGGGGTGGVSNSSYGTNGAISTFSSITSAGGGFGGSRAPAPSVGNPGGSGGGGGLNATGGTGNTPPVSPPQGQTGGGGTPATSAAGGGGAGAVGGCAPSPSVAAPGGAGATSSINGTPTARAGGGGGGGQSTGGTGGTGGGGAGATGNANGTAGTTNTGGGGGGAYDTSSGGKTGGAGGSGIVIIRYKFQ
jgi:hypothetical protein